MAKRQYRIDRKALLNGAVLPSSIEFMQLVLCSGNTVVLSRVNADALNIKGTDTFRKVRSFPIIEISEIIFDRIC